ncbi:MAG: transposase [Candidatus Omnitrophica bacterium]|nr:transposase [Candidatus Omnitrophota bacterium]
MKYRKNIRLKGFDYKQNGAYFVTICTDFKKALIGEKERLILEKELNQLPSRFEGVTLDYFVIMGNHLHIIFLFNESSVDFPKVVQAFKSITTLKLKREGFKGEKFWQRNYYEHVIRGPRELGKIREYIQNNPLAMELKFERDKKS